MTGTIISIEEYLTSSYRPDVDYVDGQIEQRHMGEIEHGQMIMQLMFLLREMPGVFAYLETRTQVAPARFRVPDVCAYVGRKPADKRILTTPPFLCIEVLSPEDRISRAMRVAKDYFRMGVTNVWIVDPLDKVAYVSDSGGGLKLAEDKLTSSDGRIVIPLDSLFVEM
jgi:Uma2 family endonuclease